MSNLPSKDCCPILLLQMDGGSALAASPQAWFTTYYLTVPSPDFPYHFLRGAVSLRGGSGFSSKPTDPCHPSVVVNGDGLAGQY